jgi:protein TilB
MPRLTEALIRKRAEHNEGVLSDLEEVALHQQELEKIENLEACCRHIRILLLQNNIIPNMEGLSKLKELEYLNLALNNISMIEGLEGCESLTKLDMTVNFVKIEALEESVYNLKANIMLEDLYMVGNPCTEWSGYRAFCTAHLPQLKQIDGKMILPRDRIEARQQLPQLQASLELAVKASLDKQAREAGVPVSEGAYTPESRYEMYMEMAEQKEEKDRNERRRMGTEPKEAREVPGVYNARGEIRQCNEGKYDFNIDDTSDPAKIVFELGVPKYLDTTMLDVDVNPLYVRCVVRDKVTQLKLPKEVRPDASKVQRSRTTGQLRIEMPLVDPRQARETTAPPQPELRPLEPSAAPGGSQPRKGPTGTVSVRGIYKDAKRVAAPKGKELLREVRTTRTEGASNRASKPDAAEADSDDEDVPPLEVVARR